MAAAVQARKSTLIFANNVVGAFLGLVAVFFTARYLEKEAVGLFAVAFSIAQVATRLADLGFDKAHIKRVSEGQDLGDCITTFSWIKLVMTTGATGLVLVGAMLWDHFFGFSDATTFAVLVVTSAYFFVFQMSTIAVQTFNALRRTALSQLMALTENLGKVPAVVFVAIAARALQDRWAPLSLQMRRLLDRFGVEGPWSAEQQAVMLGLAYTLGIIASFVVGVTLMKRHRYPSGRLDPELLRTYIDFALPLAAITLLTVFVRRVDTIMIGYFWSASESALYFQAERLVTVILMVPTAVATLFFPLISSVAKTGDKAGVRELSLQTQRTMSLIVVPLGMLGIVYASEGIHIFLADSYLAADRTLRFLVFFVVGQAMMLVGTNVLMGFGRTDLTMRAGFLIMGLNFVLNVVFIPNSILGVPLLGLRAAGAALATAIAQLVGLVFVTVWAARLMDGSHIGRQVVFHLGSATLTGIILHLTRGAAFFGGLDRFWELGLAGVVGIALYLGFLALAREFTGKDVALALDVLHPGRMASYIRDELRGKE